MKVLIFQSGEPLHIDPNIRPMRAVNLANKFIERGHEVLLISSKFDHFSKKHRKSKNIIKINNRLRIMLLDSPGYKKNIGLNRLWDHLILSLKLAFKLILKKIPEHDIFIIGFPPIETSFILSLWGKLNGIPTIIDVKDLWPEIFISRLPRKFSWIINILIYPYKIMSLYSLKNADKISSISPSFLKWSQIYSKRKNIKNDFVAPLVSPKISLTKIELIQSNEWWESKGIFLKNKPTFCFIGSLSIAFDFTEVSKAAKLLENDGLDFQLIICGAGSASNKIKSLFKDIKSVYFPGWVNSKNAYLLRKHSIASIAPYINTEDFVKSIPNKIIDSLSYSLPIISTLKGEVNDLITDKECGLSIENDFREWKLSLKKMISSTIYLEKLKVNCEKVYLKNFNYDKNYNDFILRAENLLGIK